MVNGTCTLPTTVWFSLQTSVSLSLSLWGKMWYMTTRDIAAKELITILVQFSNFMKRKQWKFLRRFGYVILIIIIKFGELSLWISQRIIDASRSYIKHSKECLIKYSNTEKLVKESLAEPRFFNPLLSVWISDETLFLVFDVLVWGWTIWSCAALSVQQN